MAVEEGQSRCLGGWTDSKKGPSRFRAAGLVALNPQPNCEGAGTLPSGQKPSSNRHPRDGAGGDDGGKLVRRGRCLRGINHMELGVDGGG
jgi:hypothetical protein